MPLYAEHAYRYPSCCAIPGNAAIYSLAKDGNFWSFDIRPRFGNGFLSIVGDFSSGSYTGVPTTFTARIYDATGATIATLDAESDAEDQFIFASPAPTGFVDASGRIDVQALIRVANAVKPGSGTGVLVLEVTGGSAITTLAIEWKAR